jgi:hypothetical protein
MVRSFVVALALTVTASPHGEQQPAAVALQACLADNSTGKDRKDLARWVFMAMTAHPEMKVHTGGNVDAMVDESSKTMAALVTRLLTESCVSEAKAAMKGGQFTQSLQVAFGGLGQLAMQELMADQAVQRSMGWFERYIDQKRLAEVFSK